MIRPIDANRLLSERMKSKYYHLPNGDIAIPIIDIENAPTIEPALPEVIRCKDCKYYDPNDHCYLQGAEANDFCSYAERRTDE